MFYCYWNWWYVLSLACVGIIKILFLSYFLQCGCWFLNVCLANVCFLAVFTLYLIIFLALHWYAVFGVSECRSNCLVVNVFEIEMKTLVILSMVLFKSVLLNGGAFFSLCFRLICDVCDLLIVSYDVTGFFMIETSNQVCSLAISIEGIEGNCAV